MFWPLKLQQNLNQMRHPKPLNEMVNKMVLLCPSFAIEHGMRTFLNKRPAFVKNMKRLLQH